MPLLHITAACILYMLLSFLYYVMSVFFIRTLPEKSTYPATSAGVEWVCSCRPRCRRRRRWPAWAASSGFGRIGPSVTLSKPETQGESMFMLPGNTKSYSIKNIKCSHAIQCLALLDSFQHARQN